MCEDVSDSGQRRKENNVITMNWKIINIASIFIIIVSIFTGIIFLSYKATNQDDKDEAKDNGQIVFIINMTNSNIIKGELPYVGSKIIFNITKVPDTGQYYWDFGDGSTSMGSSTHHIYSTSDHFYITAHGVIDGRDYYDNISVSVKNVDKNMDFSLDTPGTDLVRSDTRGIGYTIEIEHGITYPSARGRISVVRVRGTIELSVWIEFEGDDNSSDVQIKYLKDTYRYEDTGLSFEISPSDLEGYLRPFRITLYINLIQGKIDGYEGNIRYWY